MAVKIKAAKKAAVSLPQKSLHINTTWITTSLNIYNVKIISIICACSSSVKVTYVMLNCKQRFKYDLAKLNHSTIFVSMFCRTATLK